MTTAGSEWAHGRGSERRMAATREAPHDIRGTWWLFLATGIAWLIFSFVVLSFDYATVWAVALFLGVSLIVVGLSEFLIASVTSGWRWGHVLLGIAGLATGILALVWPDQTFFIAATIIAWYLLVRGVIDILISLGTREYYDLWWIQLLVGIAEVGIGFWAVGYTGRSMLILAVWIAAAALFKGLTDITLAFRLRSADRAVGRQG